MKTIIVDFDGVIHSYMSPWVDAAKIPDPPVRGAISWLQNLTAHYSVVIWSSRNAQPGGINAMLAYLKQHGLPQRCLDVLLFPSEKPPAHLIVDDRAYQFNGPGTFPSISYINSFKPWNKRSIVV